MNITIRLYRNTAYRTRNFSTVSPKNKVTIKHEDLVTFIGIDNTSKRNSLNMDVINRLKEAFNTFERCDTRAAVLYGETGTFCSGFDINDILDNGYDTLADATRDWRIGPLCSKPVVCAINGYAVAEGFELALACDLRVIEDTASMGFLNRRFGVPMALGGAERLGLLVGQSRALDLVLSGRLINGTVANTWGLAARSVATGTAIGQSFSLATAIAKYPVHSMNCDRLSVIKPSCESKRKIYEQIIESDRRSAITEISQHLPKFLDGIGKHGKCSRLYIKKIPAWDSYENDDDDVMNEEQNLRKQKLCSKPVK